MPGCGAEVSFRNSAAAGSIVRFLQPESNMPGDSIRFVILEWMHCPPAGRSWRDTDSRGWLPLGRRIRRQRRAELRFRATRGSDPFLRYLSATHYPQSRVAWIFLLCGVESKRKDRLVGGLLFLHYRPIKDRPVIKACLVPPPKAPSLFIRFLDWQLKK